MAIKIIIEWNWSNDSQFFWLVQPTNTTTAISTRTTSATSVLRIIIYKLLDMANQSQSVNFMFQFRWVFRILYNSIAWSLFEEILHDNKMYY